MSSRRNQDHDARGVVALIIVIIVILLLIWWWRDQCGRGGSWNSWSGGCNNCGRRNCGGCGGHRNRSRSCDLPRQETYDDCRVLGKQSWHSPVEKKVRIRNQPVKVRLSAHSDDECDN